MTAALRIVFASFLASSVLAGAAFALTGNPAVRTNQLQQPQPESGEPLLHLAQHRAHLFRPRFIVQAVGYYVENETGIDISGSDEIYAIFDDLGRSIRVRTRTKGDVDDGETKSFDADQLCMTPIVVLTSDPPVRPRTWTCDAAGVRAPFSVRFSMYENDELTPWDFCFNGQGPDPDCEDNRLGERVVAFTEADLLASLPNVGASVERTVRLSGYDFTYRITRVQDQRIISLPTPPRPQGAQLPAVQVHRSGTLSAALNQQFEFDNGAVVANNGDFAFVRLMLAHRLTPGGGARIWPGGTSARGYAACAAGGANYVTNPVVLPPVGSYACYITSEGRVGEFHVDNLSAGATLTLSYTTWQ